MITVLIIYAISWFILLCIFIDHKIKEKRTPKNNIMVELGLKKKEPWYLNALIIVLAPLAVLLVPYILLSSHIKDKKEEKYQKEQEFKAEQEKSYCEQTFAAFQSALTEEVQNPEFINKIVHTACQLRHIEYDDIMNVCDKLSLDDGYEFGVEECECNGSGDCSKLYILTDKGEKDYEIWNYLHVENSLEGAWQAYLLYKLWHILPLFWHANYSARYYIYSEDCMSAVSPMMIKAQTVAVQTKIRNLFVEPQVVKTKGKYYVSCLFWSDFGGLKQEVVEITISADNKATFKDIHTTTLYEYDCGILF